jgi:exonuclease SbcC
VTGIGEVNPKVEEIIGVNVNQFKQIMMIPQGEFRKLLTASTADREKVLNQLFDTGLYGLIQKRLDLESKACTEQLGILTTKKSYIIDKVRPSDEVDHPLNAALISLPINVDQVLEGIKDLGNLDTQAVEKNRIILNEKASDLKEIIQSRTKAEAMNKMIETYGVYEKELTKALEKETQYSEELTTIELAKKAESVYPFEVKVIDLQKDIDNQYEQLSNSEIQLKDANTEYEETEQLLQVASSDENLAKLEGLSKELVNLEGLIEKVSVLEGAINEKNTADVELKSSDEKNKTNQNQLVLLIADQVKKSEAIKNLTSIDKRLSELVVQITKHQYTLETLTQLHKSVQSAGSYKHTLQDEKALLEKHKHDYEMADRAYRQTQHDYHLNPAAILAVGLEMDQPCPVCGSISHPSPAKPTKALITKDSLELAEKQVASLQAVYNKTSELYGKTADRLLVLDEQIEALLERLEELPEVMQIRNNITDNYDLRVITEIINQYEAELKAYKAQEADYNTQLEQQPHMEAELARITEDIIKTEEAIIKSKAFEDELIKKSHLLEGQISSLEKDVPEFYRQLPELLKAINIKKLAAEKMAADIKVLKEKRDLVKEKVVEGKATISTMNQALKQADSYMKKYQLAFRDAYTEAGFRTEDDYKNAKLDKNVLLTLEANQKAYNDGLLRLKQSISDSEKIIGEAKHEDLNTYEEKVTKIQLEQQEIQTTINGHQSRLTDNKAVGIELKNLQKEMKAIESEYAIIGKIATVANGHNKYNITFERYVLAQLLMDIVDAANLRLNKMTGNRYRLSRAETLRDGRKGGGLDLEVFDHFTGKSRPVTSL